LGHSSKTPDCLCVLCACGFQYLSR
jgi:hypothetical protein